MYFIPKTQFQETEIVVWCCFTRYKILYIYSISSLLFINDFCLCMTYMYVYV